MACIIVICFTGCLAFHLHCGTAHWAKHIHEGMLYDDVVECLGEPQWLDSCASDARFDLDNGQSLIISFQPVEIRGVEYKAVSSFYFVAAAE